MTQTYDRASILRRGAAAGIGLAAFGLTPRLAGARSLDTTLSLVAYSTPKPVMAKIISDFQATQAGQGISFNQSYGASTSQAKSVIAGLPADLVKPGVQVVTPNPFSSGSAKWNILAAYGAERKLGKTDKQATAFVRTLFRHVVAQDTSGSNATNTFLSGKGDVLITYESEAYAALAAGKDIHMVIPKQTMLIQLPMVATKNAPPAARQFISFAQSPPAQTIFAENGYRPIDTAVLKQRALKKWRLAYNGGSRLIFKIADPLFGGWSKANKTWFDPTSGRMVGIEQAVGGPTGAGG